MSKTPSLQGLSSFPQNATSYKRRSLQSPFILHDLVDSDDDHSKPQEDNDEDEEPVDTSFTFEKPIMPESSSGYIDHSLTEPKFPSLNSDSPTYMKNKRSHKRNTSTASMTYTPPMIPVLPPNSSNSSSPLQPAQPFKFTSMDMNNNSSESLLIPEGTSSVPGQQILPKANYRRGHRYKHSSISMNMFQDPVRLASLTKPKLPEKYPIPTVKEVISMISLSQRKKLIVCFIQAIFVLLSYLFGFKYSNSCLSTFAHILFYDVVSNLSYMCVQLMSNFLVWRIPSLQYPFGLGRIEVLLGFALSVSLLFVGLDLISHIAEELIVSSILGIKGAHSHQHPNDQLEVTETMMNPIGFEVFIIACISITIFTSHYISDQVAKEPEVLTKPNVKRISSITLNEPLRENLWDRVREKLGLKTNILYNSTTGLSLVYGLYCLYYPFAQGVFQLHSVGKILHKLGIVSGNLNEEHSSSDQHAHIDDAFEVTEWINHGSTIVMAIIVSTVAWNLIWRLGNILLLASPSINFKENSDSLESMITTHVSQIDVYKNSYSIEEVRVARLNTRVYVIIMKVNMSGASDDDESKFRFYTMRIVRGLMYQAVKGSLSEKDLLKKKLDENEVQEENRRSLIDLLNLSTSIEDLEGLDKSGDQFEITIDVNRL
ncbi:hypothetical protein CANINC_000215 [Pichia inconspicua]|uniref:Cation efflux protein transmembrane domain-containing protein n=1 Tax=Pichia inconspicua TaxID=52247 RepID=A0A4T0X6P1_9ASCO|nr:hypothetical protein CANINC_000215 [[Candida] inconspicua]